MMNGCFSDSYAEARGKFLGAALEAGAVTNSFALGVRGPDGGELATDVAWLGAADAPRVLATTSGVHGVEGFFGSATQIEWLRRAKATPLPKDTAVLHVHAVNPYGFAYLRRTNEENIDINRNWIARCLKMHYMKSYLRISAPRTGQRRLKRRRDHGSTPGLGAMVLRRFKKRSRAGNGWSREVSSSVASRPVGREKH